jgi:hypothetical protein
MEGGEIAIKSSTFLVSNMKALKSTFNCTFGVLLINFVEPSKSHYRCACVCVSFTLTPRNEKRYAGYLNYIYPCTYV